MSAYLESKFEYEEQLTCICGQTLTVSTNVVTKKFLWGKIRFVQCVRCGSWCQSPQITLRSLVKWFDSPNYQGSSSQSGLVYANYIADEASRLIEARFRYKHDLVNDLPKNARVLEVGCAMGTQLSVLRDHGCKVVGLDLSSRFVEAAKSCYNLNVIRGDFNEINLPQNYFDAIILFGTIGNLQNLSRCLERFHMLLKSNGLLVFNYVDASSLIVKYLYRSGFWMFSPSVNCIMSKNGCAVALQRSGFRILTMRRDIQKPSFQKLFRHAKCTFLIPLLKYIGLDRVSIPFALPFPSLIIVKARRVLL